MIEGMSKGLIALLDNDQHNETQVPYIHMSLLVLMTHEENSFTRIFSPSQGPKNLSIV
jgi:hypothetical protein